MSNFQRVSKFSWIIILFLVATLSLPAIAQPLTPSEIDALKAQLVTARAVDRVLTTRLQCYVDNAASLESYSSQLQQAAGDLHRREQELSAKTEQAKLEAESFRGALADALREVNDLEEERIRVAGRIQSLQGVLDECKSEWYIPDLLCDAAGEISGLNDSLRDLTSQMHAADMRAKASRENLREAESRAEEAIERFKENQSDLAETERNLSETEGEIKVMKAALSQIRVVQQNYSIRSSAFGRMFDEFEALDPNSDRRFVLRSLRRESADLDDLLVKTREFLDNNRVTLPNGDRICAS